MTARRWAVAQCGDIFPPYYRTREAAQREADRLNREADEECGEVVGDGAASVIEVQVGADGRVEVSS